MKKIISTLALLGAIAGNSHATMAGEAAGPTDPASGKPCVAYIASEATNTGLVRMHFRNTCSQAFQIRIPVGEKVRKGRIEAGTPAKPAKAQVTCRSDDVCETADWEFEAG